MTPDVLASARAEFAAWYQSVDARRRTPWAASGAKPGRALTTLPWCSVCGAATFAKGLCSPHYWQAYRRAHRATVNATDRAYRQRHREEYNRRARERKRRRREQRAAARHQRAA